MADAITPAKRCARHGYTAENDICDCEFCQTCGTVLEPGVMDPETRYCPSCSTLLFPDGRTEPVRITSYRETKR